MKPPAGDPQLLLRAAARCMTLARELDGAGGALAQASGHVTTRWAGAGADAFGGAADRHRGAVTVARRAVERLGVISRSFAHELADEQERARHGDTSASKVVEERITLLRKRFRHQLAELEGELNSQLSGARGTWLPRTGPPRLPPWLGPIVPPRRTGPPRVVGPVAPLPVDPPRRTGPPMVTGPVGRLPVDPPRWKGPIRPPGGVIRPNWPFATKPGIQNLPWTPPWLSGPGEPTPVQPIGI